MRPIKSPATVRSYRATSGGAWLERLARWCQHLDWQIRLKIAGMRARRQEPELFNAAYRRPAWQSSTHGDNDSRGAGKGTNGLVGGRGYSATKREAHPWWMVELEADWPIHSIRIHGRRGFPSRSATGLQVSISRDQQHWEIIYRSLHHFGDVASPGPLIIRLLETRGARFVKLELPEGGQLVLNQVEIMVAQRHRDLLRVSRRYGFIFEKMTSLRAPRHFRPFSVRNVPPKFSGRIRAFHVDKAQGRLGNNLLQIGTAVCLANHLGVPRVYLTKLPMLEIERPMKFGKVTVRPDTELERDKPDSVLRGAFFHRQQFGDAFKDLDFFHIAEAARAVGKPIFLHQSSPPILSPSETDLVIHLRAGDIFTRPNPHTGYAQPPLAFYRLCIDFARAELGVDRVILVYENERNPCVGALKALLDEIGVPHLSHSRSLSEDMAVLMAAPHCVFGHGTFGLVIGLLSDRLKTIIHPWLEARFSTIRDLTGIRTVRINDVGAGYIKSGEWRNTAEQRQLMLDYPIENLRLTPD